MFNLDIPVQTKVALAPYTTYGIGGPADYFVEALSVEQLVLGIKAAISANIPYFVLGTGANILIRDGGFRGLVIHNGSSHVFIDNTLVRADSGVTMAALISQTAEAGLSGLEHFAGIPSSVGGAMRQNLHFLSPDRQRTVFIEEVVASAEILDENLSRRTVGRDFFQFGYDDSILHHSENIVLSVTFTLSPKPKAKILRQMSANLEWRQAKQPQLDAFPSCGSVFKKINDIGAGRLIDQAGLKGRRIGGAQISEKHANFIVNVGNATAKDVLALASLVQSEVYKQTGHKLEMEIGVVGEE